MKLEEIKLEMLLSGIEFESVVKILHLDPIPESGTLEITYKLADGKTKNRLLSRREAEEVQIASQDRPFTFLGDGEDFKLTVEATRMELAHLFDPMMAVYTSDVEPLPHQITAVYESMLPLQPLRFVLADDPGAGKTIMAGLYISELRLRADAHRVLIIAPGSLVEQWDQELFQKFGLEFRICGPERENSRDRNPFEDAPLSIARLDQLSRNDILQDHAAAISWDLIVFDEAHKLSAPYTGNKPKYTKRFNLAKKLGSSTRHLLLMTATPHNGKQKDFQLFLSLLDPDRFYGNHSTEERVDVSDVMRRMVKEDLKRFDGSPLFPKRIATTVNYQQSAPEKDLYERVTEYVKEEMGKADELDGKRKSNIGFALTLLQRRLASSPAAIHRSLKRRYERLQHRLLEYQQCPTEERDPINVPLLPEDDDDFNAEEWEKLEESLAQETVAETDTELEKELVLLAELEERASELVQSREDTKWKQLSELLQSEAMRFDSKRHRQLIIFTEHKDTLFYLQERIADLLGQSEGVVAIHGGTPRKQRLQIQERFRVNPEVRILVATDAASEGVNLQNAHLMINYDLPWNPNRLEQRFGRIHRIGQTEACHLWNLVAGETREGKVYSRLLEKIQVASDALDGRVFDVLGQAFEGRPLRDLLVAAIRSNEDPFKATQINRKVDQALELGHLNTLLNRNALSRKTMSSEQIFQVKGQMEQAEAKRLQPHFVGSFFIKAFQKLGGSIRQCEQQRYEIKFVPPDLREQPALHGSARLVTPVVDRYRRICFEKQAIQPEGISSFDRADLMHPGHPLMAALTRHLQERNPNLLREGAILQAPNDARTEVRLLFLLSHEIMTGDSELLSKRLQFVWVDSAGKMTDAHSAPHLDLKPLSEADGVRCSALLDADWLKSDQERQVSAYATCKHVPEHMESVAKPYKAHKSKVLYAVNERLQAELSFQQDLRIKAKEKGNAGNQETHRRIIADLESRLERRKKTLKQQQQVVSKKPVVLGCALVVPMGLLLQLRGEESKNPYSSDLEARKRIERLAMVAVTKAEEARGWRVTDVSALNCGWDLTSSPPQGCYQEECHLEVKGRHNEGTTITVTNNEVNTALNQGSKYYLAIVLVGSSGTVDGPYYVNQPFKASLEFGIVNASYDLKKLLKRSRTEPVPDSVS